MGIAASTTGINKIPVDKNELIKRLKENKEKHEREFRDSFKGYQKKWIKDALKAKRDAEKEHEKAMSRLSKAVEKAQQAVEADDDKKLTRFPTDINGVEDRFDAPPRCYTSDYELALDLFGMFQPMDKERPGVIDLSPSDFAHYCRDDWSWKQEHRASVANYGLTGPSGPVGPSGPSGFVFTSLEVLDQDECEDE